MSAANSECICVFHVLPFYFCFQSLLHGRVESHIPHLRSLCGCIENLLQASGTNQGMNSISQTVCSLTSALINNCALNTNVPSLHTSDESEPAPIKVKGALLEQRPSDDVWLENFPYHPQESNCSRNDENFCEVKHSSPELSDSDRINLQLVIFSHRVKRKLSYLNTERNV